MKDVGIVGERDASAWATANGTLLTPLGDRVNVKGVGKPSAESLALGAQPSLLCLLGSSSLNTLACVPLNFVICCV